MQVGWCMQMHRAGEELARESEREAHYNANCAQFRNVQRSTSKTGRNVHRIADYYNSITMIVCAATHMYTMRARVAFYSLQRDER
jgi:ribosomal protein L32